MPGFTFLGDHEVRAWQSVPDDKECDELLQELRTATGENWLIGTRTVRLRRRWRDAILNRPTDTYKTYTLYADCHGEWQVMNLITPHGGSNFYHWRHTREAAMNFMLGMIAGMHEAREEVVGSDMLHKDVRVTQITEGHGHFGLGIEVVLVSSYDTEPAKDSLRDLKCGEEIEVTIRRKT